MYLSYIPKPFPAQTNEKLFLIQVQLQRDMLSAYIKYKYVRNKDFVGWTAF